MPRNEPRKRKGEREEGVDVGLGLGGVFKGIGDLVDLVAKMVEEAEALAEKGEGLATRTGEIKGLGKGVRGVYGINVRTGLGGMPRVERFGNVRATETGPVVDEVREPLVDVFEEEDEVLVVAEVPGVGEGDINIEVKGNTLSLSTSARAERKYAKDVPLPCPVAPAPMATSFKNGVLEIHLKKTRPTRSRKRPS